MIWSVVKAWLGHYAEVLLVMALVLVSVFFLQARIERMAATRKLDQANTQLATLRADSESAAREVSEQRRSTEREAESANVSVTRQHAADANSDRRYRDAVAARLRQRAEAAATGGAGAASAPAGSCGRLDVPPVAQLPDESRERLVGLAASAVATGRALDACRRYVVDVVLPACSPGTLMEGAR